MPLGMAEPPLDRGQAAPADPSRLRGERRPPGLGRFAREPTGRTGSCCSGIAKRALQDDLWKLGLVVVLQIDDLGGQDRCRDRSRAGERQRASTDTKRQSPQKMSARDFTAPEWPSRIEDCLPPPIGESLPAGGALLPLGAPSLARRAPRG
jgi:hypothetical protein